MHSISMVVCEAQGELHPGDHLHVKQNQMLLMGKTCHFVPNHVAHRVRHGISRKRRHSPVDISGVHLSITLDWS